jgi:hypothetical protein
MNLTKFIDEIIEKDFSPYDYFEKGKNHPTEWDELNTMELQYFEDGYKIYKRRNRKNDDEIDTYIFDNDTLYLHLTEYYFTDEIQCRFYEDNQLIKTVWCLNGVESSYIEYDLDGKVKYKSTSIIL